MPLTKLKNGACGRITAIKSGSSHGRGRGWGLIRRLEDMGLTPGTEITVVKSAPLTGPLEIVVRGSRLAIGRGIAERIYVENSDDRKEINHSPSR